MCLCVCVLICVCERYSPGRTKPWKGAWASWASAQRPLGPAGLKEWGISSNPKRKSQRKRGKKPSRPCSGASSHPLRTEVRLRNVRNLSRTKKSRPKKRRGLLFYPNSSPNPWTTLPVSTQISQAVSKPIRAISITTKSGYYQNHHKECRK